MTMRRNKGNATAGLIEKSANVTMGAHESRGSRSPTRRCDPWHWESVALPPKIQGKLSGFFLLVCLYFQKYSYLRKGRQLKSSTNQTEHSFSHKYVTMPSTDKTTPCKDRDGKGRSFYGNLRTSILLSICMTKGLANRKLHQAATSPKMFSAGKIRKRQAQSSKRRPLGPHELWMNYEEEKA
ncbi:unnamed protein product [Nesidiocoris tenuis]|uniref:Uncharacterized protein n=1 Tax=Nesidiocoris tenuis TaxID=355587 RepID=A0A6H5HK10_9HEMI|nr:unnamed protein product [Nesidiocoris tenuis]